MSIDKETLEHLHAQIMELHRQLERLSQRIEIRKLLYRRPFPANPRDLRALIEAYALTQTQFCVRERIPLDYLPKLEVLARMRAGGLAWPVCLDHLELAKPSPRIALVLLRQDLECLWAEVAGLVKHLRSSRLNEELAEILEG